MHAQAHYSYYSTTLGGHVLTHAIIILYIVESFTIPLPPGRWLNILGSYMINIDRDEQMNTVSVLIYIV